MILMLINVMLLVLGCFMDMAPLMLICTPILLPVVMKLGVDPVHFGMIMLLNLGIGLLTPPVGSTLFVGCAVGKVTLEQVMKGIWAVLRRDVRGADAGDLHSGAVAVVAGAGHPVAPRAPPKKNAPQVRRVESGEGLDRWYRSQTSRPVVRDNQVSFSGWSKRRGR